MRDILSGPIFNVPQDIAIVAADIGKAIALSQLVPATEARRLDLCVIFEPRRGRVFSKAYTSLDYIPETRTVLEDEWFERVLAPGLNGPLVYLDL